MVSWFYKGKKGSNSGGDDPGQGNCYGKLMRESELQKLKISYPIRLLAYLCGLNAKPMAVNAGLV